MGKNFIDPKGSEILSVFQVFPCTTQIALFWPKLLPALFLKKLWYPCPFEILAEALTLVSINRHTVPWLWTRCTLFQRVFCQSEVRKASTGDARPGKCELLSNNDGFHPLAERSKEMARLVQIKEMARLVQIALKMPGAWNIRQGICYVSRRHNHTNSLFTIQTECM
jgi:hypothetical protein